MKTRFLAEGDCETQHSGSGAVGFSFFTGRDPGDAGDVSVAESHGLDRDEISLPEWVEEGERSLTEFAEFYKLADRVESGLLNALLMLQSALLSLKASPEGSMPVDPEPWDEPWREIGEDYRRLCGLLMGGKTFSRLDVLEQARMRMRLEA
ncbi:MAG TPA: hypothetical protein PLN52_20225 [Opitutaceae bacterium]|nr:hypothetical protein [Opitutaceae bacterium]